MSFILNIDTASEKAHISFAKEGNVLYVLTNESQKEHASFLQAAIEQIIKKSGINLHELDAIAVTAGPGSYTGLRVGMASAKGLCYALKKPLITLGTLEVLTASAISQLNDLQENQLLCPMMDARRMEVFTALYKTDLTLIMSPIPMILDEFSFENELMNSRIRFFGSGSDKWKLICNHYNASFDKVSILPESMSKRSNRLCYEKKFTELAYSEPIYLKEFQTVNKNLK